MLTRCAIMLLVFTAFALGLAQLVRMTGDEPPKDPMMACQEWSNPACGDGRTLR
jgi:hypothetical protein